MKLIFSEQAWEDYLYWQKTDKQILKRVNKLIAEVTRSPFEGIGKPEPLKYLTPGAWSRRLTQEHRIVYLVREDQIDFLQARYHY